MGSEYIQPHCGEPLAVGDLVLDRYRVERRIAAGGHSIVYRGSDQRLSRPVCIKAFYKVDDRDGIRQTAYEHFVQEAFALSKLSHPNTLCIYDFGHVDSGDGELPLQVSEFMSGGTLSEIVHRDGVFSLEESLEVARKLAEALAEAHRSRIIHRDIKPQNILFTARKSGREPKLADFGIAKSLGPRLRNQAEDTHVVAGFPLAMYSPSWAAPEQLRGATASASADIYSLALVTIYCITGRSLLVAKSTREGYQRRRQINALIDKAFEGRTGPSRLLDLFRRSCAFEASERPQSAEEFVEELAEVRHSDRGQQVPRAARGTGSFDASDLNLAEAADRATLALPVSTDSKRIIVSLSRLTAPQSVGSWDCQFLEFGTAPLTLTIGELRLQLTCLPGHAQRVLHVRGLSSFVALAEGRPTVAVQLANDSTVRLLDPSQRVIAEVHVSFGQPAGTHRLFQLDGQSISIDSAECPNALMIDSSTHQESYFLYSPPVSANAGIRRKFRR